MKSRSDLSAFPNSTLLLASVLEGENILVYNLMDSIDKQSHIEGHRITAINSTNFGWVSLAIESNP